MFIDEMLIDEMTWNRKILTNASFPGFPVQRGDEAFADVAVSPHADVDKLVDGKICSTW